MLLRKTILFPVIVILMLSMVAYHSKNTYKAFAVVSGDLQLDGIDRLRMMNEGEEIILEDEETIHQFVELLPELRLKQVPRQDISGYQCFVQFFNQDNSQLVI